MTKIEQPIAVLGASGMVGDHLLAQAKMRGLPASGTCYSQQVEGLTLLDLTEPGALEAYLGSEQPRVLFWPAGNPAVDWAEDHEAEARRVNVEPILRALPEIRRRGIRLVYYSSDYVFDGADGPNTEEDVPKPLNVYGRQKLEVEGAIRAELADALVLRICWVFGEERLGKNFVVRAATNLRKGAILTIPSDQVGNPSSAKDVARASFDLLEAGATGVRHVAGPERMPRSDFAKRIAQVFGLNGEQVHPTPTAELGQRAPRPLEGGLDASRAAAEGVVMRPVDEALADLMGRLGMG